MQPSKLLRERAAQYFDGLVRCQPRTMFEVDAWLQRARGAMSALWTYECLLCGARACDRNLCNGCENDLPRNDCCCRLCAEPLATTEIVTCGECAQRRPRFDRCIAPYRFSYPLDHMVRSLKYGGALAEGRVLGELLADRLVAMNAIDKPDLLIPVPLGARRYARRGYNQASELAIVVSRRLGIPMCTHSLVRFRETLEQAALDRKARRKNLRKAFQLVRPLAAKRIAIVDDVVTTGSTANEIARVLKRGGARRVDVWAIARAGRS